MHSTPETLPTPEMIPPAAILSSYISYPANCENSTNGDPGSNKNSIRSLGRSLFREICLSRAFTPPPKLLA